MKKNNEDYFTLAETAEIFSRNKNTIQAHRRNGKISAFKEGTTFFYSFKDCLKLFKNYSVVKYRILSGGGATVQQEAEERKQEESKDFSKLSSVQNKSDADFVLQLEKIRELRRENDEAEKKLIRADLVKSQAESLFSILFESMREFIEKLGIENSWNESYINKVQKDFNALLFDAKLKALRIANVKE